MNLSTPTSLTFLGTADAVPDAGRDVASFVINGAHLVDMGWYSTAQMFRYGIDPLKKLPLPGPEHEGDFGNQPPLHVARLESHAPVRDEFPWMVLIMKSQVLKQGGVALFLLFLQLLCFF